MAVDEFLPAFDFNEVHFAHVNAPPERVLRAVRELTARDVPLMVVLMAVRSLPALVRGRRPAPSGRLLDGFERAGFVMLAERPGELVLGAVGRFWTAAGGIRPVSAEEFAGFAEPGYARAAIDFRAVEQPSGRTLLTTETRIQATDDEARRRFARYWRVVHPGSALIRRGWLRAVQRRAERG
jgi:hypothetical protein